MRWRTAIKKPPTKGPLCKEWQRFFAWTPINVDGITYWLTWLERFPKWTELPTLEEREQAVRLGLPPPEYTWKWIYREVGRAKT